MNDELLIAEYKKPWFLRNIDEEVEKKLKNNVRTKLHQSKGDPTSLTPVELACFRCKIHVDYKYDNMRLSLLKANHHNILIVIRDTQLFRRNNKIKFIFNDDEWFVSIYSNNIEKWRLDKTSETMYNQYIIVKVDEVYYTKIVNAIYFLNKSERVEYIKTHTKEDNEDISIGLEDFDLYEIGRQDLIKELFRIGTILYEKWIKNVVIAKSISSIPTSIAEESFANEFLEQIIKEKNIVDYLELENKISSYNKKGATYVDMNTYLDLKEKLEYSEVFTVKI